MILYALMAVAASAGPSHNIDGSWQCAAYELQTPEFNAVVASRYEYASDGTYKSASTAEYSFGGNKVQVEATYRGRWTLDGSSLRLITDDVEIAKVVPPVFTPTEGEDLLRNGSTLGVWHDYEVLQSSPSLIFERVNAPEWLASDQFSCKKA
ncbi:hypothetical protein [Silanimonas sp.]|jgi:hypothetical protein|uniref:hypothetical protein n=1 Tax=Silanimonas sp. TaxID=1929290 RepID=UPI0037CAD04B